jgi:predicted transcriptional regulator
VDQAENVIENFRVIRILFELDELDVNQIEALVGLGQKFSEKIVHEKLAPAEAGVRRERRRLE